MCSFIVYLLLKNYSVNMVVVRKLDAKVKKFMHGLCPKDITNRFGA